MGNDHSSKHFLLCQLTGLASWEAARHLLLTRKDPSSRPLRRDRPAPIPEKYVRFQEKPLPGCGLTDPVVCPVLLSVPTYAWLCLGHTLRCGCEQIGAKLATRQSLKKSLKPLLCGNHLSGHPVMGRPVDSQNQSLSMCRTAETSQGNTRGGLAQDKRPARQL